MAYTPVSGSPIQYSNDSNELASGYYLKFYIANTTTPLSMVTDSTGSVPLVKCKLNTDGIPITNPADNTTTFIPYVDQKFRYVIYKTEADADADTTANAFVNLAEVDTISGSADLGTAAFADLTTDETDTTGALRAEDAYHADSINYHTGNLLIEEGTWTPVISDANTGGNLASATIARNRYSIVGGLCTLSVVFTDIDTAGMTAANTLFIQGMPFLSNTVCLGVVSTDNFTLAGHVVARTAAAQTYFNLRESSSGAPDAPVKVSAVLSASSDLDVTITYQVDL